MEEELKNLEYWRKNAEEDYLYVPISVLRYITELEKQLLIEFGNGYAEGLDDGLNK